ncbi:uncharacterized protein [Primulina eburnea]|uniref:uncharacterized protein n=1 Tax=Primulina eburnea TaxID=1245227 RepID=UPI003C6C0679
MKGLQLQFKKNMVQADLIMLPIPEFDIILGMDWLCTKELLYILNGGQSVQPPSGKPFIFEATRHQQISYIISCICAKRRGCQAFLASIDTVTEPVSHRLEEVEVVRDFPSVFPDDVSGIPSDREVNFSIEVMPGKMQISKAPYRLAPVEMKELKDQIQNLLDKGFIRPSFSPWGGTGTVF